MNGLVGSKLDGGAAGTDFDFGGMVTVAVWAAAASSGHQSVHAIGRCSQGTRRSQRWKGSAQKRTGLLTASPSVNKPVLALAEQR
jgi:hypothetical protein